MGNYNMSNNFLTTKLKNVAQNQLNCDIKSLKYIGGGSFGKVYKATKNNEDVVVLKAYRNPNMQIKEATQLELLSKNTRVNMPNVYFTYEDNDVSIMCMSFIDGKNTLNPLFLFKNEHEYKSFANDVAIGMSDWHSVKNDKYGFIDNPKHSSWKDFYFSEKVEPELFGLKRLAENGKFNMNTYKMLEYSSKIYRDIIEEPEAPVLTHCDLNIMNIMANPKDMKLTGFIDPCGSMYADKEYDLFQLQNMWGNRFKLYETYKSLNIVSKDCDFKTTFYGAMNENSVRLTGGLSFFLWEELWNNRLTKILKKY